MTARRLSSNGAWSIAHTVLVMSVLWSQPAGAASLTAGGEVATVSSVVSVVSVVGLTRTGPEAVAEAPGDDAPASVRARYWFELGYAAATQRDFRAAGEAFDASFAAIGAANTLFNAAYAYEQGGMSIEALDRYRTYLARFRRQPDAVEVERALVRLEAQLAELSVRLTGAVAPVRIEVEGKVYSTGDFPVWLPPGEVEVVVIDGREQRRAERLLLRPGQRRTLELTFVESVVPRPMIDLGSDGTLRPERPERPDPQEIRRARHAEQLPWSKGAFVVAASLSGTGAIAAGTLGALAVDSHQTFQDGLCVNPCPPGSTYPAAERKRFETLRDASNVMTGVAAVSAVTALTFGLIWRRAAKARKGQEPDQTSRIRVEPQASGLALRF